MFKILFLVTIVLCIGLTSAVSAQDAAQKTHDLIAALDKNKYKKKEKAGSFTVEVYIDIKNVPVVKKKSAEFTGVYEASDLDYRLDLSVSANGAVTGSGQDTIDWDNSKRLNFTLKDARIGDSLLTGTKVYENGETRKFEAVFANRTVTSGTNPNHIASRSTIFGLGFIESGPVTAGSTEQMTGWKNRVFLERSDK